MAAKFWSGNATGTSPNWNYNSGGLTNWGSASGVADNVVPPTSVDDVTFDGAGALGNSNSTISSTISCLSLTITAGYTATMTHNATLTISLDVTLGANYTIAGSSSLIIGGVSSTTTSVITSNGQTWPNNMQMGAAGLSNQVFTIVGDLTIVGSLSCPSRNPDINKTTSEIIRTNGLSHSNANTSTLNGTIDIIVTGGTISNGATQGIFSINSITFQGDVAFSSTLRFSGCNLYYVSGTIDTSGSTIVSFAGGTYSLDISAITIPTGAFSSATNTVTLLSDLNITSCSFSSGISTSISTSVGAVLSVDSINMISGSGLSGTAKVILGNGTWQGTGNLASSLDFDGNSTVSGSVTKGGGTTTYVNGSVTTTGSTMTLAASCTLDTNGIIWNNITLSNTSGLTHTINSSLDADLLTFGTGASTIFAGTSGFTVATLSHPSTAGGNTVTLKEGITYTITAAFNCNTTRVGSTVLFTSAHGTTRANILMPNNGSNLCNVLANFTRIDATGGRTITTFGGTITDCVNVRQFYDYYGVAA